MTSRKNKKSGAKHGGARADGRTGHRTKVNAMFKEDISKEKQYLGGDGGPTTSSGVIVGGGEGGPGRGGGEGGPGIEGGPVI